LCCLRGLSGRVVSRRELTIRRDLVSKVVAEGRWEELDWLAKS
jgi:hypothetical protein